jgi:hypothetical protein
VAADNVRAVVPGALDTQLVQHHVTGDRSDVIGQRGDGEPGRTPRKTYRERFV